jgi:hypothetical protein
VVGATVGFCVTAPSAAAAPAKPFSFLAAPYTQELYGTGLNFAVGVAFAPDGDPVTSSFGGPLVRFDTATTTTMHGSVIHTSIARANSALGLGLANGLTGKLYSNTTAGVIQINPDTGATVATPTPPTTTGNTLGIATDPKTGNLVYADNSGLSVEKADVSATSTFSTAATADGLAWEPTGNYLFAADNGVLVLNRSGGIVQTIGDTTGHCCADGMAFHGGTEKFVLSNNTDGSITKYVFPNDDYTQPPTESVFASGGFRGDHAQVGPDGCLYVSQSGTRFADGTEDGAGSLVRICGGFIPPVPRPPTCRSACIFQVELRKCTNLHVGYNYFPAGTVVRWNVAQNETVVAHGQFTTLGGGKTYHFLTQPLGVTLQPSPDGHVHFHWTINNVAHMYTAIRKPGC